MEHSQASTPSCLPTRSRRCCSGDSPGLGTRAPGSTSSPRSRRRVRSSAPFHTSNAVPLRLLGQSSCGSSAMGPHPANEVVVNVATTRRQVLCRISKGMASPLDPLRPAIWADTTDQHSKLRALEMRWQSRAAAAGSGSRVLGKWSRGRPDPSSYTIWMGPSRRRPP